VDYESSHVNAFIHYFLTIAFWPHSWTLQYLNALGLWFGTPDLDVSLTVRGVLCQKMRHKPLPQHCLRIEKQNFGIPKKLISGSRSIEESRTERLIGAAFKMALTI